MEKLEEYVDKETFKKLSDVDITTWEELLEVHRRDRNEFWNDFSKTIAESQRIKIEKVLYRECCWDGDKFYYNINGHISDNGELQPRQLEDDGPSFELIRFEATVTSGNMRFYNTNNEFVEEKLIIDRLERTCYRKIHYVDEGPVETKFCLDYYDLNKIFYLLRQDVYNKRFRKVIIESFRYRIYKLTYADGSEEIYNIWDSSTLGEISHLLYRAIISKRRVMTSYRMYDILELD